MTALASSRSRYQAEIDADMTDEEKQVFLDAVL